MLNATNQGNQRTAHNGALRVEGYGPATFRAGDTVHHQPSGEDWVLACDEYQEGVMPAGWPESRAKASDCKLIEAAADESRLRILKEASAGSGVRADLARRQLAAVRGAS